MKVFLTPTTFIVALERWLDSSYSAAPRWMRGFQESHRVCLTLGLTVMISAVIAGLILGSLANSPNRTPAEEAAVDTESAEEPLPMT